MQRNLYCGKADQWLLSDEGWTEALQKGIRKLREVMDMLTTLIVMRVSQVYLCKTHNIVHVKCVHKYIVSNYTLKIFLLVLHEVIGP